MDELKKIILTGDRPTGKLHLGHYVGSLQNRVKLQNEYNTFIIIADFQVLVDHLQDSSQVEANVKEIVLDYLSVGIDPSKSTIFIQSAVPQLSELTTYLSMLVTVARLRRNPTVKAEAKRIGIDSEQDGIIYGFLGYPVSQAADILLFRAHLVPAGEDQRPHIEQTRELADHFNKLFGDTFPIPDLLISETPRLPGLSGEGKMSKSLGNAIYLSDPIDEIRKKIQTAFTDPARIKRTDIGHPEICPIFSYHRAFDCKNADNIATMCSSANIGCVKCKQQLTEALEQFLKPIQQRRADFAKESNLLREVVTDGCEKARQVGEGTMELVRKAVRYDYSSLLL